LTVEDRRIAQLEDEVPHLRGTKPRRLAPPSAKPFEADAAAGDDSADGDDGDDGEPEPAKPAGTSWTGPADGPPPWLKRTPRRPGQRWEPPKPITNPPVAKSGAETEAQRVRVNADRSIEYRVMGGAPRSGPWRGHTRRFE
jgi:hypothetical protein